MARLTDEIVEEIHATRREHAARFDNDIERILDDLCASQEKRVAEGWPLSKTVKSDSVPRDSALQRSRFAHHRQ